MKKEFERKVEISGISCEYVSRDIKNAQKEKKDACFQKMCEAIRMYASKGLSEDRIYYTVCYRMRKELGLDERSIRNVIKYESNRAKNNMDSNTAKNIEDKDMER